MVVLGEAEKMIFILLPAGNFVFGVQSLGCGNVNGIVVK